MNNLQTYNMRLEQLYLTDEIMVEGNFMKSLPLLAAGAVGAYNMNPAVAQDKQQAAQQDAKKTAEPSKVKVSDKDLYEFITQWEGKRSKVYQDTKKIPTIGVGFNLQRSDARKLLKDVGADYDKVLAGEQELNDKQIQYLLEYTVNGAKAIAHKWVPELDYMYPETQKIVIDMAFQLGPERFPLFKKFLAAINNWDYQTAADELVDSKWYGQSGNRSRHHVETLLSFIAR